MQRGTRSGCPLPRLRWYYHRHLADHAKRITLRRNLAIAESVEPTALFTTNLPYDLLKALTEKDKMANINDAYRTIIAELSEMASPDPRAKRPSSFPGLIAAGETGSVLTNEAIEKAISDVAIWLFDQKPALKNRHTRKEWSALVRKAFGPAIASIDLAATDAALSLRSFVEKALEATPATVESQLTTIGCTLFYKPIPQPIGIGPVRFEPKEEWLARAVRIGQISEQSKQRLEAAFRGEDIPPAENDIASILEGSIIDVLGRSQLACTVETNGLAPELSQKRAIIAARLAQTSIGLLWALPSSTLEGFHLSVEPGYRQIRTIPFRPGAIMAGGSRSVGTPRGPDLSDDEIRDLIEDARNLLDLAGQMISCWTSADAYDQASKSLRRLAQSIFFFWEGCKESDNLMSIVKFTAALEALAQAKSSGILSLIEARLSRKKDDKLIGSQTAKEFVDLIYSKGRSRTLHGTNEELLHDWSSTRTGAESLTRHCLVQCMGAYLSDPQITDFKK